jgi:hypothetical protein
VANLGKYQTGWLVAARPWLKKKVDSSALNLGGNFLEALNDSEEKETPMHQCKVCFEPKLLSSCIAFEGCSHFSCMECIEVYFTMKIREGRVMDFTCPEENCAASASEEQVSETLFCSSLSVH